MRCTILRYSELLWEKMGMKKKICNIMLILSLNIMTIGMLTGCGKIPGTSDSGSLEKESEIIEEEEEKTTVSTLTGLPVSETKKNKRPLAVMLNNIKAGCPQSGTGEAAIIYEAPVEGRITRLMGIFEDYNAVEEIGSIRSSRDYFVYFALEYDAIYAHFGQATPYVGELLNSDRVDNISGAVSGIHDPAPHSFFRSTEKKAPHNVYLDIEGLNKDIKKFDYPLEHNESYQQKFVFSPEGTEETYEDQKKVSVIYPGGKETDLANGFSRVQAKFEYNPDDNLYYRYQYGDKHIDATTGEQLAVSNVILQYCHGEIRDENDYLAFGCHGDDGYKVQVFTGGKMVEGSWSRSCDEEPAKYVDENGDPIQINPGKTWVCIVWNEYGEDVVIE